MLTLGSALSRTLILTLLQIGGIETNPGPMTDQLLLTELILGASDDAIKRMLANIKDPYDNESNRKALQNMKVDALNDLASYLNNWSADEASKMSGKYKKEGLIILILRTIVSMLPMTCCHCNKENYSLPSDLFETT